MLTWTSWLWAWPARDIYISVDEFRQMLPLFADREKYPDEMIEALIDAAKCFFNPCIWGCKLQMGMAYWIAHRLLIGDMLQLSPIGVSSFATSKKVGDTSVSYSQGIIEKLAMNPNYWTRYGQLYDQLAATLTGGIGIMIV